MTLPSRKASLRALFWAALSAAAGGLIALGRSVVLARLLAPSDFGLFGLATFALSAAATLTELNLGRAALVTRFASADEERRFLDTAFTAGLLRRAALVALFCAAAPLVARALGDSRVLPLLFGVSAPLLIYGLGSPATVLLQRDLALRPLALSQKIPEALGALCTIAVAALGASVWSLVIGAVVTAVLGAASSWRVHPYRPRLLLDGRLLRVGFAYGRHVSVVMVLTFVTTQVDNLFVGRALGAAVLGTYLFAYRIAMLPVDVLSQVVGGVVLPGYVRLRAESVERLEREFLRALGLTVALLAALLLPVALLPREVVLIFGGARWEQAIPLLPPLALAAFLRGSVQALSPVLHACGRVDLDARGKVFEAALFVPACFLLVAQRGMAGAALAGVLTYALALLLRTAAVASVLPGSAVRLASALLRPWLLALAAMLLGALLLKTGLPRLLCGALAEGAFLAAVLALDGNARDEAGRLRRRLAQLRVAAPQA